MTSRSRRLNQSLTINCASEQPFKPKVYSQALYRNEAFVLKRSSGIFPQSGLTWAFRLMQSDLTGSETMQLNANIKEVCVPEWSTPQALPVALFPQTRNFTPLCLSTPRCINGYRRHTAIQGVTLRSTSIPSGGEQQYPQVLHANETGISYSRLGLCLVCAFTFYLMQI